MIRRQIDVLRQKATSPDVLVNLTNDGWFWGSSELEMHLACGVFRAVECRKPLLIAANTGISGLDRRRRPGPGPGAVATPPTPCWPRCVSTAATVCTCDHGDWPAAVCLLATLGFALLGLRVTV